MSSFPNCFQPKPKATNLKLYQSAWVKDKVVLSVVVKKNSERTKVAEAMILEFTNAGVGKQRNRATRLCYQSRLFKTD